jgi:hypothetical protein
MTMTSFLALHGIAARRGEGLRPELVRLLECRARAESNRASRVEVADGDRFTPLTSPDLTPQDTDTVQRRRRSAKGGRDVVAAADSAAR